MQKEIIYYVAKVVFEIDDLIWSEWFDFLSNLIDDSEITPTKKVYIKLIDSNLFIQTQFDIMYKSNYPHKDSDIWNHISIPSNRKD